MVRFESSRLNSFMSLKPEAAVSRIRL